MEKRVIESPSTMKKVGQILRAKCPNCGKANVFYRPKFPLFGTSKMKDSCENCNAGFKKSPGFFRGAVLLSYVMAILEGLLAFFLARELIFGLTNTNLVFVAVAAIALCLSWNYRVSRVIWLNTHTETA